MVATDYNYTNNQLPFNIDCSQHPELEQKVRRVFQQMIYAPENFGSATFVCKKIIDEFKKLHIKIVIDEKYMSFGSNKYFTDGRYFPNQNKIELSHQLFEDDNSLYCQAVILHEMTHAIHDCNFTSMQHGMDSCATKDLECSVDFLKDALRQSAKLCPPPNLETLSQKRTLNRLSQRMLQYYSDPSFQEENEQSSRAFDEFLARIPQMYCLFGRMYSLKKIEDSLNEIFPVGFQFFKQRFLNEKYYSHVDHFLKNLFKTLEPLNPEKIIRLQELIQQTRCEIVVIDEDSTQSPASQVSDEIQEELVGGSSDFVIAIPRRDLQYEEKIKKCHENGSSVNFSKDLPILYISYCHLKALRSKKLNDTTRQQFLESVMNDIDRILLDDIPKSKSHTI